MDFIEGVIGLAVLSSPFWLIALIVPVAIATAVIVAKRFRSASARIAAALAIFLSFFLALFGDEIAGRMYLNHLCATEAGAKVYQRGELSAEYWDDEGMPKYFGANGFVDMSLLPKRFEWRNIEEPQIDSLITITKRRWQLFDKNTEVVLGERISYMRHFGWLKRFSPAPNVGEGCGSSQNAQQEEQEFFRDIFRPPALVR